MAYRFLSRCLTFLYSIHSWIGPPKRQASQNRPCGRMYSFKKPPEWAIPLYLFVVSHWCRQCFNSGAANSNTYTGLWRWHKLADGWVPQTFLFFFFLFVCLFVFTYQSHFPLSPLLLYPHRPSNPISICSSERARPLLRNQLSLSQHLVEAGPRPFPHV